MKTQDEMLMPAGLPAAVKFFWQQAGYGYTPGKETPEAGRLRGAQNLAAAEGIAREAGYSFDWEVDQVCDSSDWSDETPPYEQYTCTMRDVTGRPVQSLCGIDFGRDNGPYGDYRRVVEAELAAEECAAVLESL